MTDQKQMTFLEHLEELRSRLIRSLIAVLVGMIACWAFHQQILGFLLAPLYEAWANVDGLPNIDQVLNFSSLVEPFVASMKIAAIGGIFVASPYVLYQLWRFISPGLYARERRLAFPFVAISTLLFVGGSLMAYSIVFPIGFTFFLDFAAGRKTAIYESTVDIGQPLSVDPPTAAALATDQSRPNRRNEKTPVDGTADVTWYEVLISRFTKSDCGTIHGVVPSMNGSPLMVDFEWHSARCGDIVVPLYVKIDGKKREAKWSAPRPTRRGFQCVSAVFEDQQRPGASLEVVVPTNDQARKLMPVLMLNDYLSFAMRLLLAFGLIFELPVIVSFLALAGIVNHRQLLKFGRWFIILAFVIAAILTPPDVLTQVLLALPLIVLYYASVLVAYWMQPKP